MAISQTLDTLSTLVLSSPLGNSVASFVASLLIPPDVIQGLEFSTPDAIELGAYGSVNLNTRIPVGLTGGGGFEFLLSPKTGKGALYGDLGAGLSFGSTASGGSIGGNLGLVFNCATSQAYTGDFTTLTIPIGALPPKIRLHLVEGFARANFVAIQNSIPVAFGSVFYPVIGLAATVTPSSWSKSINIFFAPFSPHVFGVSFGLSASTSIGEGTSNWALTWSYYWQLLPGGISLYRLISRQE
jgi:hypothetical protein